MNAPIVAAIISVMVTAGGWLVASHVSETRTETMLDERIKALRDEVTTNLLHVSELRERHQQESDRRDEKIESLVHTQSKIEVSLATLNAQSKSMDSRLERIVNLFESGKFEFRRHE